MDNEVFTDQGDCARCGRKLKDELSIERGYGPVCWEKTKEAEWAKEKATKGDLQNDNN